MKITQPAWPSLHQISGSCPSMRKLFCEIFKNTRLSGWYLKNLFLNNIYYDMEKRMKQNKLLNLSAIFLRNLNSIDLVIKQSTWYNVLLFFVLPNWVSDEFFEGVQVVGDSIAPILGQYYLVMFLGCASSDGRCNLM